MGRVAAAAASLVAGRGRSEWGLRALVLVALLAVGTSLVKVNVFYGYRPTFAAALELPSANQIALDDPHNPSPRRPDRPACLTLARHPRPATGQ